MAEKSAKGEMQEIGLYLKARRDELGLTLDDVFKVTRISVLNLEAIEGGEYHNLPPAVYTRNYLTVYAKMLDVDHRQVIGSYDRYLASLSHKDDERPGEGADGRVEPLLRRAVLPGLLSVLFLIVGLSIYQSSFFRKTADPVPTPSHQEVKETVVVNTSETPPAETREIQAQSETKRPAQVKEGQQGMEKHPTVQTAAVAEGGSPDSSQALVIKAHELTWLRITDERRQSFQVLMKPGEKIERSGRQFTIDIGNAGGISIEFQGNTLNNLGSSGKVIHVRLPEEKSLPGTQ